MRSKTPAKNVLDAALAPDDPSKWNKKIAKDAKRAINLEKEYKRLKAGLKKCDPQAPQGAPFPGSQIAV